MVTFNTHEVITISYGLAKNTIDTSILYIKGKKQQQYSISYREIEAQWSLHDRTIKLWRGEYIYDLNDRHASNIVGRLFMQ